MNYFVGRRFSSWRDKCVGEKSDIMCGRVYLDEIGENVLLVAPRTSSVMRR